MKTMKRLIVGLLISATLLSCTGCAYIFDGIFGTKPTEEPGLPYEGHYLTDLYEPYDATRNKHDPGRFSSYVTLREEITMAGESFHKGIRFSVAPWDGDDLYFDYDIGGKYENISFFYGMTEDTPWYAENVAFQVINVETKEIIWEELFEIGDIPRFVTVNISGVNKLRLECYNKDGGDFAMTDITLWEGESQAKDRSYPVVTKPTMLEDNYKFYYADQPFTMQKVHSVRNFGESSTPLSIKGEKFDHAALIFFGDDVIDGANRGDDLYMNLRGQFKQISFYWGLCDTQINSVYDGFEGWISIYADGKCVLDEYVCTTETPARTIVLDVDYAWQLRIVTRCNTIWNAEFCLAKLQGGENLGEATDGGNRLDEPVPMIRTYPPYFQSESSAARATILDSSSRYEYFSMAGIKYCEGILLQPVWNQIWDSLDPAYVITDLEGEQKYLSFTMGHVDNSPYKNAVVNIYLDDEEEPSYVFEIGETDMPKDYVIDVRNCRTIKFLCYGPKAHNLSTIGIANIVAYPDEVVENDIFQPYYKEYPDACDLLEYFPPFGYYSAYLEQPIYYDGVKDDGKYFETCDGTKHKKGVLFCSSSELIDWDYVGLYDVLAMGTMGYVIPGAQSADRHSFYFFNLNGQYDTLTFKTAKVTSVSTLDHLPTYINMNDPECTEWLQELKVYGDDGSASMYSCKLIDGQVQEHTIDVSGVTRLILCVPANGHSTSEVYAGFDLVLSKDAE